MAKHPSAWSEAMCKPLLKKLQKIQAEYEDADNPEQQALDSFIALIDYFRKGKATAAGDRMTALTHYLQENSELNASLSEQLHQYFLGLNIYPVLVNLGIMARRGMLGEMATRLYDRLIPPPHTDNSSLDVLARAFYWRSDAKWLGLITPQHWLRLYSVLAQGASAETLEQARSHIRNETLYVLEMLSIWLAAEELEPELMRVDRKLIDIDSPFIALQREMHLFIEHEGKRLEDNSLEPFDVAHLWVMLAQCQEQVDRIRRRGRGSSGSSMAMAHLLERLEQTIQRLQVLLGLMAEPSKVTALRRGVLLWQELLNAAVMKNSMLEVWRRSTALVSRSITQNSSDHGEHYIARDRSSYFALFRSAAGAGIIIALMALMKIHIESLGLERLSTTVLVSLNYGLGFVLVHLCKFTIATKQPAVTAASFAAEVERNDRGRAVARKLAVLLIDVNRSQWAAVWGNISTALLTSALLCFGVWWYLHEPLLSVAAAEYQMQAIRPFESMALLYAAIAGVWLFCSGLIAGFFDNRADYVELRARLYHHRALSWLGPERRERFTNYVHENYGSVMGNFLFGVLLGSTSYFGYLLGYPLDIRHVAFSSANLGYASFSEWPSLWGFLQGLFFVLLIGFVNLWVSFSIALQVAVRARGTKIQKFRALFKCIWQNMRENPLHFFFPTVPERGKDK